MGLSMSNRTRLLLDLCDERWHTHALMQEWNSELYDKNARFVSDLGTPLITSLLRPGPGERILDLGCGDGDLTAKIAGLAPGVEVTKRERERGECALGCTPTPTIAYGLHLSLPHFFVRLIAVSASLAAAATGRRLGPKRGPGRGCPGSWSRRAVLFSRRAAGCRGV